jgi:hypothetical protein
VNYQYSYFKPITCPAGTIQNEDGMSCSVEKCAAGERRVYPEIIAPNQCTNDEEIRLTEAIDSRAYASHAVCDDVAIYPNGLEQFNCKKLIDAANYAQEQELMLPIQNI